MKNLLILIVAAAVYLHFYPNEEVTQYYNDSKIILLDSISEFTDTKVRLKANKIYLDLKNKLAGFSEQEIAHLKEITYSRENVKDFYFTICKTEKRDYIFHVTNEKKVCATISPYSSML